MFCKLADTAGFKADGKMDLYKVLFQNKGQEKRPWRRR